MLRLRQAQRTHETECPAIRVGNGRYVPRAKFKCSKCASTDVRLYQADQHEAEMFLAGDPLRRQIGR